MKEYEVLLKVRVSAGSPQQADQRIAELVAKLDETDDPFITIVDAVREQPIKLRGK